MTRFLPRFLVPLVWLLAFSANAQSPSPAQIGITHSTVPEVLQVLDHTQTWAPIGNIDPTTHQYMLPIANGGTGTSSPNLTPGPGVSITGTWPNQTIGAAGGGSGAGVPAGNLGDLQTNAGLGSFGSVPPPLPSSMGGEADIVVTDPTVGMAPVTSTSVTDNSPFFQNLMNKMGPPASTSGYDVTIPGVPYQTYTEYYFSQTAVASRGANYHCSGTTWNPAVYLVFAPGVDGWIQESYTMTGGQGSGGGMLSGCFIFHLGFGTATANALTPNTLTGVTFQRDPAGLIPSPNWSVGDGIFLVGYGNASLPTNALPAAPIGTTITAIDGVTGNLTLSGAGVSPFFGYLANSPPFIAVHSTATFTQTASNNFVNNDALQVGSTTYHFKTTIGAVNDVLPGVDFPTSAANLIAAMTNAAGQYVTYIPSNSGAQGFAANVEVKASYAAGVITFTSIYSGPGVNTFPSVYTPAGTAAGAFANPTFTGANTTASCTGACVATNNISSRFYQFPVAQAFKIQTTSGSNSVTVISGPQPLKTGDVILSDAFPFGTTVSNVTGTSFPQTVTMTVPTLTGTAQNATATYAPGAEGNLWIMYADLVTRTSASAEHNRFNYAPIGQQISCTSGGQLSICTTARSRDNYHQFDLLGTWLSGNNASGVSLTDDTFATDFIADIFNGGTLGLVLNNNNTNSYESGNTKWGYLVNCGNANSSILLGGYYTAFNGNACANQVSVYPPGPGGTLFVGPQLSASNGPALAGAASGQTGGFTGAYGFTFKGGTDGKQCTQIGGQPAAQSIELGVSNNACTAATMWQLNWNSVANDFEWIYGANATQKFVNPALGYTGYAGNGLGNLLFPFGVILGGDGNNPVAAQARLFGTANTKPAANWHALGDTEINTLAPPGGQAAWYLASSASNSPQLSAAVVKGTTTSVAVSACPTPTPPAGTLVADNSQASPVNLGTFLSCTTGPNTLNFQAAALNNGSSGDFLKFLQWYGAGPISNDVANPDYTATTIRSGSASNKDVGGRITLAAGTATYTLTGVYATAPVCFTADATTPGNASSVSETSTVLTFTGTGTDVIKYHCIGRN